MYMHEQKIAVILHQFINNYYKTVLYQLLNLTEHSIYLKNKELNNLPKFFCSFQVVVKLCSAAKT